MLNKNVMLNKIIMPNNIVILSEAKNLRFCHGTVLEILRSAQNDIPPQNDIQ